MQKVNPAQPDSAPAALCHLPCLSGQSCDSVRLVAHLGGFRDQIMWQGQTRLAIAPIGPWIWFRAALRANHDGLMIEQPTQHWGLELAEALCRPRRVNGDDASVATRESHEAIHVTPDAWRTPCTKRADARGHCGGRKSIEPGAGPSCRSGCAGPGPWARKEKALCSRGAVHGSPPSNLPTARGQPSSQVSRDSLMRILGAMDGAIRRV